jgi:hemerythrin
MQWSEQFSTGIQRVDDQHKMLFTMAEGFRAALDEGKGERVYEEILHALDLYARAHFRFEERCMDKYHCPMAQRNQEAHEKFVAVLVQFQQRHAERGFDRADARDLVDTLEQWLADHIGRIDVHLKHCVKGP